MNDKLEAYKALASQVTYDPETGIITWNFREELTSGDKIFNALFAGRECGSINDNGYRIISFMQEGRLQRFKAHRLAWLIMHGWLPYGDIDHINRNRDDNRISNLRDVNRTINMRNASMYSNNKSGATGVSWNKSRGKWQASVRIDGKLRYLGIFACIHEATAVVNEFRAKHGFTDSHGAPAK